MKGFLSSRWSKVGVAFVVFGWGHLLLIIFLAAIGLWPDPNPNPIGPGLLFAVTVWPAPICLGIGACKTLRKRS